MCLYTEHCIPVFLPQPPLTCLPLQDLSPLENHHVAASFMVAAEDPAADIFHDIPVEDKATLRASMIDLILGEAPPCGMLHITMPSSFDTTQSPASASQCHLGLPSWDIMCS